MGLLNRARLATLTVVIKLRDNATKAPARPMAWLTFLKTESIGVGWVVCALANQARA
jgi:hypothetical protein